MQERTLNDKDKAALRAMLVNYNGWTEGITLVLKELSMVALDEGIWFRTRPIEYKNEEAARIWAKVSAALDDTRLRVNDILNGPRR